VLLVLNSLGAGGTERSTAVLLPRLVALGIEPTVVCLVQRDGGDEDVVRGAGIEVRVLRASSWPGRVRELRRICAEVRPALVHTAIFDADIVGRLAAWGSGIPVLSSLVNTPYVRERFDDPRIRPSRLRAVQAVDALTLATAVAHVHAVTAGVADHAVRALGVPRHRISVVERGRDLGAFAPESVRPRAMVRADLGIDADAPVLLAVGRVEYQKGFVDLVEATARLRTTYPGLVTLIAGREGNASTEVNAAIARSGTEDMVRLLGPRTDVADLLAACDAFVLSSRYEGTAGAALEAMAAGAPIVATDLAGTADILDGSTALAVTVADPVSLAAGIDKVLTDGEGAARRAETARQVVTSRFDLGRAAREMAGLYATVAAGPARPPSLPLLSLTSLPVGIVAPARPGYLPGDELADESPTLCLSVVVCVHNGADTVAGTLEALADQQWDRPWELVLVDNASTDATPTILASFASTHDRTRVVPAPARLGLSYARNVGVSASRGRSVVFCDADDLPAPGWVAALGDALDEHRLVVPRLEYDELNEPGAAGWSYYQGDGVERMFGVPVASGVSGWRRRLWIELGGNDETLGFSGEDTDMSLRAVIRAGVVPHFVGDAVYHYRRRTDGRSTWRQAHRFGRAQVVLFERWGRTVGARPDQLRLVLATWFDLVRRTPLTRSTGSDRWWWRAGLRSGRLRESLRRGTWYP
jgi:glycosyltransferase involved in cell wall biosynthesis/GT2 family glycosyltransferase